MDESIYDSIGFSQGNMSTEEGVHTDKKSFSCYVCERKFTSNVGMIVHMKIHPDAKPFECEVCKERASSKVELQNHMKTHHGEKPYECEICKKKFAQETNLKVHVKIHASSKLFSCKICKKKFLRGYNLKTHMRTHTREKPFECDICEKKFSHASTLRNHVRIHTGEKPYECHICKKKFTRVSNFNSHMRFHIHEKSDESEDAVSLSSRCPEKNENTLLVNDENVIFIKEEVSDDFGSDSCSDVDSDCQDRKIQVHVSGIGDDVRSHLKIKSEDSFKDIFIKEEIDIHEVPFEDPLSEEFEKDCVSLKTEATLDDT